MTEHDREVLSELSLEMLAHIQTMKDTEVAHIQADAVLTNILRNIGFEAVVREYEKVGKWYA